MSNMMWCILNSDRVNWNNIVKGLNYVECVVYLRSNVVKTAISSYRGKLVHDKCGESNIRLNHQCDISSHITWTVTEFIDNVNVWQVS